MSELNMVQQMLPMVQTQVQTKSAKSKANNNAVDSFETLMSNATSRKNPKPVQAHEGKPKAKEQIQELKPQDPAVELPEEDVNAPATAAQPDPALLMSLLVQQHPAVVPAIEETPVHAEVLQVTAAELSVLSDEQPAAADPGATQMQQESAKVLPKSAFQTDELPKFELGESQTAAQSVEHASQSVVIQNTVTEKEPIQDESATVPAIETESDKGDGSDKTTLVGELAKQPIGTERLNIKVGENFEIQKPEFPQKVADKILYSIKDGVQNLQIQLTPNDLGKITINVVLESGKAVVTLACANPKTQELLNEHIGSLRSILESHTGNETVVHVEKQDQQMYQRENYDGHSGNQRQQQEQKDSHKPNADEVNIFIDQLRMGMKVTTMY